MTVAGAHDVAHQHVVSERAAAHHRRLDPQGQAAIEAVALQHLGILVEPPVEARPSARSNWLA